MKNFPRLSRVALVKFQFGEVSLQSLDLIIKRVDHLIFISHLVIYLFQLEVQEAKG